jgi:hypothetical protein
MNFPSNLRASSTTLCEHTINLVLVFHFQHFRGIGGLDAFSVKQKAIKGWVHTLATGIRLKHLLHFGGLFYLEIRFFAILLMKNLNG